MQIESLETRRMFGIYKQGAGSLILSGVLSNANFANIVNYSYLSTSFNQTAPISDDLNGDSRVDLADFGHFCETAVDSIANNLIRNSAGPGDSDGNGRIDKFDIRALGASFNSYGDWQNGDFTMNRRVNIQDFALAAANVLAK